ncbi:FYVE and coiled-coil domain-containing protein 1-like isoform X9 [Dreissena polymorpha]|uniref:FYVE and coiled-coil domain-containing protein 1-like isoform X9 n=1 Tax=Dreissena polymorpha TaxID=45954 RepID=UPI002264CEAA|nr:FYVE and coiled-coil domain-containing protein 1-like isoform X9 [Dreissena polymorpha]
MLLSISIICGLSFILLNCCTMASRTDSRAGQSVQNMITCVEEVLRLAGPAKDQLKGLQPYISQLLSQQSDERKHNYDALLAENAQLKNDLLALKSSQLTICSDGRSIEMVLAEMQQTIMRGKDEILRINAVRLQAIQEEHIQMQTQLEEMRSTNATLNCQIKSLKNERDELEKSFSDQHDRNSSLEAGCSQIQTQLQYMTSLNETLSSQLQSLQKESDFSRKHEAERQILHFELEKIKKDYEQQSKQLHEVLKERETLKELVASQKRQLNTRIRHSNEEFDAVVEKNEQLQRDLLASQSRHLPAHQELTFTDECNPEHIADLYKNLYKNFWPDAFIEGTKFSRLKTDYSVSRLILNVYNAVYLFCKDECARQRVSLEKALSLDSENKLLPEYKQLITLVRCKTTQVAVDTVFTLFQNSNASIEVKQFAEKIQPFVQESIRICWLMNLHDPPLTCTQTVWAHGTAFDGNMYECYKCVGDKIDFIVWPALLMSENRQILAKGIVECF